MYGNSCSRRYKLRLIKAPCGLTYAYAPYRIRREPVRDVAEILAKPYVALTEYTYYSKRYGKSATIKKYMRSDGATGAFDIASCSWWVHDQLCDTGEWDDGTKLTNWQCSQVLGDILRSEGRWARARYWRTTTFLAGGGKARKNGMFSLG